MTVGEAIIELQRLDPKLELVTERERPVTAILQAMVPLRCPAQYQQTRKAVAFTSDPFTRPPLKGNIS
jgi:hypothetical protein